MKKLLSITLALSMLLSACGGKSGENPADGNNQQVGQSEKNNDIYGLTINLEDVSATGLKLVFDQKNVDYEGELKTSARYMIEASDGQGSWKEVEITGSFGQTVDTYHAINKNDVTEFYLDWDDIYGELPKGEYRIHLFIRHYMTEDSINKADYFRYFEIQ